MSGSLTGAQAPTTQNPYSLPPSMMALMGGLQGLAGALNPQAAGSANYMRPAPAPQWSPGQVNNLLATILQMRQAAEQGVADPYQQGVAMPRVSLLSG